MDQASRLAAAFRLEPPRALALLLAALYHDAGKAETTAWEHKRGRMVVTSAGHDIASERIARQAFVRNKIFAWNGFDVRATALILIRTHHRPAELWARRREVTRKAFNRLAADLKGEIELCAYLDAADRGGRGRRPMRGLDRESRWLLATFKALGVDRAAIAPLVMGRDLIALGAEPGPALGAVLKEIYRRQLDSEFRTKAGGLRMRPGPAGGKDMNPVFVTGGAGYIGSHTVRALRRRGYEVTVFDNLSSGRRELVGGASLVVGDLRDRESVRAALAARPYDAVLHFASLIQVGESYADPRKYYEHNLASSLNLLGAMLETGPRLFIFSSTAAVYGVPEAVPIREDHPLCPVNPYGRTKAMVETILEDYVRAHGLSALSLRYFNASGADPDGGLGECHDPETHLIPNALLAALGRRPALEVYGTDFATPDGTAVRDYIHVTDLAEAHVLALEHLLGGGRGGGVNLGTNRGYSVREVLLRAEAVTGRRVPTVERPRRLGDVPVLLASAEKAERLLGWQRRFSDLDTILRTAWAWHSSRD